MMFFLKNPIIIVFSLAVIIRLILIIYGEWQDSNMLVKFTDVDYNVYTDASRLVTQGSSPFERATYRYTPILAYLLTPNIFLYNAFGKLLFSACDILSGIFILKLLVRIFFKQSSLSHLSSSSLRQIILLLCVWLFNPLCMTVSSRGNADTLACFLSLLSLYFATSNVDNDVNTLNFNSVSILTGISIGGAVHFKIYPLIYGFAFLVYFYKNNGFRDGLRFIFFSVSSFIFFNVISFLLCGYDFHFIEPVYLYHLKRTDIKHNFSLYFYQIYLSVLSKLSFSTILAFIPFMPQFTLSLLFALKFGGSIHSLPFCMFLQTWTFVSFNKVITAQYFVWYFSLLPLALPIIRISLIRGILMAVFWFLSELHWLYWAYRIEFVGVSVFFEVFLASLLFFIVNIVLMVLIIRSIEKNKIE